MNEQRRKVLIRTLSAGAGLGASAVLASAWRHPLLHTLSFEVAERLSDLPPERSMARFLEKEDLTPNSAFFVRSILADDRPWLGTRRSARRAQAS
jgi:hypothetical protein